MPGDLRLPLYEYECGTCGHRFEKIQKFSDPPVKTCPLCRKKVRKLPSAPAIQFKGAGWYITDYARKGAKGEADSEEKGKKPSEEKPAEKKEKPEKAPDGPAKRSKKKSSDD